VGDFVGSGVKKMDDSSLGQPILDKAEVSIVRTSKCE
jgi:hypothetical protein